MGDSDTLGGADKWAARLRGAARASGRAVAGAAHRIGSGGARLGSHGNAVDVAPPARPHRGDEGRKGGSESESEGESESEKECESESESESEKS